MTRSELHTTHNEESYRFISSIQSQTLVQLAARKNLGTNSLFFVVPGLVPNTVGAVFLVEVQLFRFVHVLNARLEFLLYDGQLIQTLETFELANEDAPRKSRLTFFAPWILCERKIFASSTICCWKTSTAANRALASFSFSSSTVLHTFHMFHFSSPPSILMSGMLGIFLSLRKLDESLSNSSQ
jgi:hypothetical protein